MREAPTGSPATDFSIALLRAFVRLGVRHLVLSPGSRSQALALVAAELERLGELQLHVRVDERSAGFLALGLAIESAGPVLVVTTSGTAVANLHPAVLEAHHAGVPLVLLTADRPEELRGIRSNQTTTQPGIFGVAARLSVDVPAPGAEDDAESAASLAQLAVQASRGAVDRDPGPVQLNIAFREPLSAAVTLLPDASEPVAPGTEPAAPEALDGRRDSTPVAPDDGDALPAVTLEPGARTVVVAGAGAGAAAEELARTAGWPLLAEVTSGARFGPNLIGGYRELLQEPDWGGRIERVVVFGHPTLSREVPALIARPGVETIVVSPEGSEWYNPGHAVATFTRAVNPSAASVAEAGSRPAREWLGRWVVAGRQLREALDQSELPPDVEAARSKDYRVRGGFAKAELAALRAPVTRGMLVDYVWRASWPHDRLVFGASRLIREADRRVPGKKITVHANRGLAGIDGTVATALGIALASQGGQEPASTGVTRLLLGDLALLHDAGSLLFPAAEERPRLQVIVGNDGGGTIFDALEVAATAPSAAMERVLYTPQQADFAALASAYGWEYTRAATRSELERTLTAPHPGLSLVEVPLARD